MNSFLDFKWGQIFDKIDSDTYKIFVDGYKIIFNKTEIKFNQTFLKFVEKIILQKLKFFSILIYNDYLEEEFYSINELKKMFPNIIIASKTCMRMLQANGTLYLSEPQTKVNR